MPTFASAEKPSATLIVSMAVLQSSPFAVAWKPRASHERMVEPGGWWCTVKPKECGSDGDGGAVGGDGGDGAGGGGGGAVGGDGGARCVRQKTWYVK